MIVPMGPSHTREVAALHMAQLGTSFLARFGFGFLVVLYRVILESLHGISFVHMRNGCVAGFVTCAFHTRLFFLNVLTQGGPALLGPLMHSVASRPDLVLYSLRAAFYPILSRYRIRGVEAELLSMAVKPQLEGQGIGTAMLEYLCHELEARGVERFLVGVQSELAANKFYRKHGFKFLEQRQVLGSEMNYYLFEIRRA